MRNDSIYFILYTIIFSLKVIFPTEERLIGISILILNAFFLLLDRKRADIVLMSSFILPNEVYTILNVIIYILIGKRKLKGHKKSAMDICFLFIILFSLISAICYNTWVNIAFEVAYLVFIIFSFDNFKSSITNERFAYIVRNFVYVEFITTFFIIAKTKSITPGDNFSGSMNSAHYFANWLILGCISLLYIEKYDYKKKNVIILKENCISLLSAFIMLILADAKTLIGCLIFALIAYIIIQNKKKPSQANNSIFKFVILFYAFVWIFALIVNSKWMYNFVNSYIPVLSTYFFVSPWNGKFKFMRATLLEELRGPRALIGYGLGQYGSRVSNLFAYNQMWRGNNPINNFISSVFAPHFIPQYTRHISFYDQSLVDQIRWRSAVLTYPFNNIISLVGETGIFGVIICAYICNKLSQKSYCKLVIFYFFIACFFDLYFDNYPCIAFLLLIMCMSQSDNGLSRQR